MGTSREDLKRWFEEGIAQGATHMIVVCDTFDYEDFPVYVKVGEDIEDKAVKYNGPNMAKIMEVYNLHSMTWEEQQSGRCMNKQPYSANAEAARMAVTTVVASEGIGFEPTQPQVVERVAPAIAIEVVERRAHNIHPGLRVWEVTVTCQPQTEWKDSFGIEAEVRAFIRGIRAGSAAQGGFLVTDHWSREE